MSRSCGSGMVCAAVLVLASGCQNYNFNPVGRCVMQPGMRTFTLANVSTADVLFVVDDSQSMAGEQQKLADNFSSFITNLDAANAERARLGFKPIDFHIAVTTTSVFTNYSPTTPTWTCSASCTGASGQVCCKGDGTPGLGPRRCTASAECGASGVSCRTDCSYRDALSGQYLHLYGESYCCSDTPTTVGTPPEQLRMAPLTDPFPCSLLGSKCGTSEQHLGFPHNPTPPPTYNCAPGLSSDGYRFPQGDFVGWSDATTANPRVLHFDKSLYTPPTTTNRQGFTSAQLVGFFAGSPPGQKANVVVGTCGSNQEQALQAGRLAVEKALAGRQADTYDLSGARTPAAAEWPHPDSKLVLVFVGDEDDCSSPNDPSGGIVIGPEVAGNDACTRNDGGKEYDVAAHFVDYFMGLGRPVGAAFVVSAAESVCGRPDPSPSGPVTGCTVGRCCQPDCPTAGICGGGTGAYASYSGSPNYCGGQAAGTRFFQAASAFRTHGADVAMGSICDPSFNLLLEEIANIVKPPAGLELPTLPAEKDITVLRIADSTGATVKICGRPAPEGLTAAAAAAAGYAWWFTATSGTPNPDDLVVNVSRYVYINPAGGCIANPGETYSAEYIGQLPEGGCHTESDCQGKLGGSTSSWTCYAGVQIDGGVEKCSSTATRTGTCLCGDISKNCPNGKLP